MISPLASVRQFFEDLYPGSFNAFLGACVVLAIWALKKWKPDWFAKLPPSVQALPALFLAAVVNALSSLEPSVDQMAKNLLGGLIGGVFAIGFHRVLKESPLPYGNPPGAHGMMAKKTGTITIVFLVCLPLAGCAGMSAAQVVETVASDAVKIAQVLCLADHAKLAHKDAISVEDLCQTAEQLAPYLPAAKNPSLMRVEEPSDGGAP